MDTSLFGQSTFFTVRLEASNPALEWSDQPDALDLIEKGQLILRHLHCPSGRDDGNVSIRQGTQKLDDGKLRFVCSVCRTSGGGHMGTLEDLNVLLSRILRSGSWEFLLTSVDDLDPLVKALPPKRGDGGFLVRWWKRRRRADRTPRGG
jgi:hypothetical protein